MREGVRDSSEQERDPRPSLQQMEERQGKTAARRREGKTDIQPALLPTRVGRRRSQTNVVFRSRHSHIAAPQTNTTQFPIHLAFSCERAFLLSGGTAAVHLGSDALHRLSCDARIFATLRPQPRPNPQRCVPLFPETRQPETENRLLVSLELCIFARQRHCRAARALAKSVNTLAHSEELLG